MNTTNARELRERLAANLFLQSGLEQKRDYLGMSGIGRCPRHLYRQYLDGKAEMTNQNYWSCWLGYLFEGGMIRLFDNGLASQAVEVVADFDPRFRGHVDHQTAQGELVEIKSVHWEKFQRLRQKGRIFWPHYAQVQMYLAHGPWERAFVVYVARDVPWDEWDGLPIWVFNVRPNAHVTAELNRKAQRILAAVDGERPVPRCECGRCLKQDDLNCK